MKFKITFGLLLFTFLLTAQSARMNRDIEVAEKILESLIEEESNNGDADIFIVGNSSNVEGSYIEDFGALFTLSFGGSSNYFSMAGKYKYKLKKSSRVTIVRPDKKRQHISEEDLEKEKENLQNKFKNVVETFACDYAFLMRQLPDNEKIMFRYNASSFGTFHLGNNFPTLTTWDNLSGLGNSQKRNYSATISKSSINDFQNEKINDNQLKDRIDYVFEEAKEQAEKYKDLGLLATILNKLHKNDYENNLYLSGTSNYEKIAGIGAIYHLRVKSGASSPFLRLEKNSRFIWGQNDIIVYDDGVKKEAKDAKEAEEKQKIDLDKNYQPFLKDLKNNIIEYGSIVKSLNSKEALIFKLRLPNCDDCKKMPKNLEIIAKQTTLQAYRKESISLEKAMSQLIMK